MIQIDAIILVLIVMPFLGCIVIYATLLARYEAKGIRKRIDDMSNDIAMLKNFANDVAAETVARKYRKES